MAQIDYQKIDLVKLDLQVRQMRADAMRHAVQKLGAWLKKSLRISAVRGHQAA